jgi:hypothetical protein
MRDYPRIGQIHRRSVAYQDGEIHCLICKDRIKPGIAMCKVDIQHNWMRGDDDVVTLCMSCCESPLDVRQILKSLHD